MAAGLLAMVSDGESKPVTSMRQLATGDGYSSEEAMDTRPSYGHDDGESDAEAAKEDLWVQRLRVDLAKAKSDKMQALRVAREMERKLNLSMKKEDEARTLAHTKELEARALAQRLQAVEATLRSEREAIRPDREALVTLADKAAEEAKLAKLEKETYVLDMASLRKENDELKEKLASLEQRGGRSFARGLRRTLTMQARVGDRPPMRQSLSGRGDDDVAPTQPTMRSDDATDDAQRPNSGRPRLRRASASNSIGAVGSVGSAISAPDEPTRGVVPPPLFTDEATPVLGHTRSPPRITVSSSALVTSLTPQDSGGLITGGAPVLLDIVDSNSIPNRNPNGLFQCC